MKRRILSIITALALCLGLLPAGAWAAESGDASVPQPQAIPTDINMDFTGFVFAQGVPIVIRQNGSITSIYDTAGNPLSGDTDVSSRAIYGGWYDLGNTHSGSTSITMESGTVQAIFGGSYGDVLDGDTNVTLNGGTVGWVYGGGNQSAVTGAAHVTVNNGARIWGRKMSDGTADRGTVFGGGYAGTVESTEVIFNGGDAQWIYGGGEGGCVCTNTHVKFMGQPDDYVNVFGGGYGGSVTNAVVEFHGTGYSPANQGVFVYGGGWGDTVDHVEFIIGPKCDPGGAFFDAICENSGSTVNSAGFDVCWDPERPSMMNSSRLNGTGVTGTVSAYLHSDSSRDDFVYIGLEEIGELILEGIHFRTNFNDGIDLDRLEVKASASIAVPAKQDVALNVKELAGGGYIYFEKGGGDITPITVNRISVPSGGRIKVGRLGGLPDTVWENASLFTGAGVEALASLDCLVSIADGYELVKEGSTIKVQAGTGARQAYLDPVPKFDRENKTYRYGETIQVTMGLKCADQPLARQMLSVEGGASGHQSFATGVTDENGMATISVPVNDAVWNSRDSALGGYFAGTEEYLGNSYAVSGTDGSLDYTIEPAQVALSGEITAPARGGVPVKDLTVGGDAVCTAEVVWSPADAAFRPEVVYTASIRLIPQPGYSLGGGRLGSVTCQGEVLTLPGTLEADGSMLIANVKTFAAIPAIHPTGVTLDASNLSLSPGGSGQLTAAVVPDNADNKSVTWTSSNPAVAAVDGSGNVTAVSAGTAVITVTTADGGQTASCTVTVTAPVIHVTGVTLNKTGTALTVGGSEQLTAAVVPGDATDKTVTWTSSNPAVAAVDESGNVTAVSAGTAVITVTTADGGQTASCTVTVTAPVIRVTGVTLNKTGTTLTVGGSEQLTAAVVPGDATDKTVTWTSSNPAVAAVDGNGNVTAVGAGTAVITVTTADGGQTASCTVTVTSGGSSGGGDSGIPSTPSTPSTPSAPGVTVPVSGDRSTVRVSASVSGSTATVSRIDTTQIENVIGDNGQASMVEIDFTGLGKAIDTVKLPAAAIKDIAAKAQNEEVRGLTVKLPDSEVSFDADALSAIQAQASNQITLTVTPAKPTDLNSRQKEAVGSAPVFDLTLRSSSGAISDFRGGYATVSLPYALTAGQDPSGVVVYYLDSAGNITPCTTMYDVRSKSAIFTTGHLSLYFVGYEPAAVWVNPFSDVAGGAWYYDAVRYVSENGLMGGYGIGTFGPNDDLSRAQFAQILFNKEGRPAVNYLLPYGDVENGAWYTEAVRWAASERIVDGYGNGLFGPNDSITREQLAVMLWRYAGSPAATGQELHFNDAGQVSGYALDALRWAVENGIVSGGNGGILDPQGLATRAQTAQMLENFLEK